MANPFGDSEVEETNPFGDSLKLEKDSSFLEEAKTYGKRALGGLGAAADFIAAPAQMLGMAGQAALSLGTGEDLDTTVERQGETARLLTPSTYINKLGAGLDENEGYKAASEVLAKPAELGAKGLKGAAMLPYMTGIIPALTGNSLESGRDFASEMLTEGNEGMAPAFHAGTEIAGMFPGYGAVGKGLSSIRETVKPPQRPLTTSESGVDPKQEVTDILYEAPDDVLVKPFKPEVNPEEIIAKALEEREQKANEIQFEPSNEQLQKPTQEAPVEANLQYKPKDFVPVKKGEFPSLLEPTEPGRPKEATPIAYDPEAYRSPRIQPEEPIPFELEGKKKLKLEKSSIEGPQRTTAKYKGYETDPMLIKEIADKPELLERYVPKQGLDYWESFLEDLNLPTEKATSNRTLNSFIKQSEELHGKIENLLNKAKTEASDSVRIYAKDLTRSKESLGRTDRQLNNIQGSIKSYLDLQEKIFNKVNEIYDAPLTRKTYPENLNPISKNPYAKKQGGQFNPEIFREGFQKIKEVIGKGIRLIAKPAKGFDIPVMEISADTFDGQHMGSFYFERKGDNLAAMQAFMQTEFGRRGVATEAYKFASELGNDIVPAKTQTPDGKALWEGFAKKGVSSKGKINKQRGAADPKVFIDSLRNGSKNVEEFTKKLVDELGEQFRPLAATLYNKTEKTDKEVISEGKNLAPGHNKYLVSDTRHVDDFVSSEGARIKELADSGKDIWPVWTEGFPASSIASIARNNPAIKWLTDRALMHDRVSRVAKEEAKYGSLYMPKKGIFGAKWNHKVKSNDGALTGLERLSKKDAEKVFDVWQKMDDAGEPQATYEVLREKGLNDAQANAMLAVQKQFIKYGEKYNAQATEAGATIKTKGKVQQFLPLNIRPNYFPHAWVGDYRVFARTKGKVYDQEGKELYPANEAMWVEGADNAWQAKEIVKGLKAKFPDYEVSFTPVKNKYELNDTSAFKQALGILDKDSPEYKALQTAYKDILIHRGYRKHTLNRKGKPGYLGGKEGDTRVRDSLKAIDLYFDRAYNFLANQNKKADWGNLNQQLKKNHEVDLKKDLPNTYDYLNAFIDHSSGGLESQLKWLDNLAEGTGELTGLGRSAVSKFISGANGLASLYWLVTPRFFLSQMVQPLYNLPKGMQLKVQGLTEKSTTRAFYNAYTEMIRPSEETMAGMNFAKANGYIDSKIVDLMGMKFDARSSRAIKLLPAVSRGLMGKLEQEVVRTPAFIFYDLLLRDSIKDPVERRTMAGALTDKVMVDYTRTDAPLIYGRLGLVGEAGRPLKQFQHSYYGQSLEYLKAIEGDKSAKPLASFLGTQAFMSGLKGTLLLAEYTVIANYLNEKYDLGLPNPMHWLMTSGVGDTVTFGGVSKVTGMDMSGTLGAPTLDQFSPAPGMEFAQNIASNVFNYGQKAMRGVDTEADQMKAIQSLTPNVGQVFVEQAFTKPGEGPPNPNQNMDSNLSPRTTADVVYRGLGGRSLRESKEMMSGREFKTEEKIRETQKKELLDAIVDRTIERKELSKDLIKRWTTKGGDPRTLPDIIVKRLMSRTETFAERQILGTSGLSQAQKIQRLQEFKALLNNEVSKQEDFSSKLNLLIQLTGELKNGTQTER